jgi:hypothetical protein
MAIQGGGPDEANFGGLTAFAALGISSFNSSQSITWRLQGV